MYFVIFTPFRIVSIVIGKDFLDRKIEKDKDSYWQRREVKALKQNNWNWLFYGLTFATQHNDNKN